MIEDYQLTEAFEYLHVTTGRQEVIILPDRISLSASIDNPFQYIFGNKVPHITKANWLKAASRHYEARIAHGIHDSSDKYMKQPTAIFSSGLDEVPSLEELRSFHAAYLTGMRELINSTSFRFPERLQDDQSARRGYKARPIIIMCSPNMTFYDMSDRGKHLLDRFIWESLRRIIEAEGGRVILAENPSNSPDLQKNDLNSGRTPIYTRDPLGIQGGIIYLSDSKHTGYMKLAREQGPIMRKLIEEGLVDSKKKPRQKDAGKFRERIVNLDATIEWGNVVPYPKKKLYFLGVNLFENGEVDPRAINNALELTAATGRPVIMVPLADKNVFYHLDTFLMADTPNGEIIIYPQATNRLGLENIMEATDLGLADMTVLNRQQAALKLGTNIMRMGDKFFMTSDDVKLSDSLRSAGYTPISPSTYDLPFDSFVIGHAGVRCMTLEAFSLQRGLKLSSRPSGRM